MATLTSTNFTGLANGAAWPAPWTFRYGNNANAKAYVQNGAGRLHNGSAGQWADKVQITHTTAPTDFELTFKMKSTTDSFPQVMWRATGTEVHTGYSLIFDWDGTVRLYKTVNWTGTELKNAPGLFAYNVQHRVRLRVQGSNFKARVWKDGATEPATWNLDVTDSTLTSGALVLHMGGGAATTGFDSDWDDIVLSDFTAAPTPVTVPSSAYPTATDADGTANDRVNLTAVTGVIFTVDGQDYTTTTSVPYTKGVNTTVTARAASGYTLSGTTSWTLTFTNYVPPTPTSVPAGSAPTATDADGTASDRVNLTAVPGVIFTVDGKDYTTTTSVPYTKGSDLTVTAKAASGYVLSGTTSWPLHFTNYVPTPPPDPEVEVYQERQEFEPAPLEFETSRPAPGMTYAAVRLNGDGTETLVAAGMPLSSVSITAAPLNSSPSMSFSITPEVLALRDESGVPILIPWSSAIYAVDGDGILRFAGLLESLSTSGPTVTGKAVGWTSYPKGMPWTGPTVKRYGVDPAEVVSIVWEHLQSQPRGNIGLRVPKITTKATRLGVKVTKTSEQPKPTTSTKTTTTKTTITTTKTEITRSLAADRNVVTTTKTVTTKTRATGATSTKITRTTKTTTKELSQTTVTQTLDTSGKVLTSSQTKTTLPKGTNVDLLTTTVESDEPFLLANYATEDLGQVLDEAFTSGSIDYRERHSIDANGNVDHYLELGYPRLGRRRTDIAFNLQTNVYEVPSFDADAEDYASEVLVLGAGDGDKMVRASAVNPRASRLRKVRVLKYKGIGRTATAQKTAASVAGDFDTTYYEVQQLAIIDHPLAPIHSWESGDEVHLTGDGQWAGPVDMWVRILSTTYDPEKPNVASLEVIRADRTV